MASKSGSPADSGTAHDAGPDLEVDTDSDEPIRVLDLFCGGGGLTKAIADVVQESGRDLELVAINHDDRAIETHIANHNEYAAQFCEDVAGLKPSELFGDPEKVGAPTVHLLTGGIECVGHSGARGGKPVKPQDRVSGLYALSFVEKLLPERILFENVKQFQNWGRIFDNNDGEDDGAMFDQFINILTTLGYNVDYEVLTAADYGDPQLRDRLIILGSRDGKPTFPEPTHSPNGETPGTKPYRTAADIIDWSDPGKSIWTRDLNSRNRVLSNGTMMRIAQGLRDHCSQTLEPFADFLEYLGREKDVADPDSKAVTTIPALRKTAVSFKYAPLLADCLDHPFLVRMPDSIDSEVTLVMGQQSNAVPRPASEPLPTVATSGNIHLFGAGTAPLSTPHSTTLPDGGSIASPAEGQTSMVVRQFGGASPSPVTDPLPTIATAGAHSLSTAHNRLILPRNKACRGIHSNPAYDVAERPLHTITAKNHSGWTMQADETLLGNYSHGGTVDSAHRPLRTIATERGGAFWFGTPYLAMGYSSRETQKPRSRSLDRPLPTIPAKKIPAGLCQPYLVDYHGNSTTHPTDEPLRTVECRDRFGLVTPSQPLIGFDLKYRMLKPLELARGQSFPDSYTFKGTKAERTEQIGNAIPIRMGRAIVRQLLSETVPTIDSFTVFEAEAPPSRSARIPMD